MKAAEYSEPGGILRLVSECQEIVESGSAEGIEALKSLIGTEEVSITIPGFVRIATSAIISIGERGVDELKTLLNDGRVVHYPQVLDALWCAATRRMHSGGLVSAFDVVAPFTIDEKARIRAKTVLDDLIIQAEFDDKLREHLFSAVSHDKFMDFVKQDQPARRESSADGTPSLGSYIFSVFRAASITLTQDLIAKLATMVGQDLPELEYQRFLTAHPVFLDPLAAEVIPQVRLGSDLVVDFVIRLHDHRYVIVEIEKPQDSIFTKKNNFTAEFNHAVGQVLDFQGWANENLSYARQKLPLIESPAGLVVIGRRSALDSGQASKLRRWCNNSSNIYVLTFDDLVTRSELLHHSLRST